MFSSQMSSIYGFLSTSHRVTHRVALHSGRPADPRVMRPLGNTSGRPALTDKDEGAGDCVDLVALSSQQAASGRKRKQPEMEADSEQPHVARAMESSCLEPKSTEFFFRITHTGLGKHKLFDKGAVASHDLGVQVLPCIELYGDTKSGEAEALLDISLTDATATKLGTWLSEQSASFADLRKEWKIWQQMPPELSRPSHLWNLEKLDVQQYVQLEGEELRLWPNLLQSLVDARALPDHYGISASRHVYVPDPTEEMLLDKLCDGGVVLRHGDGFQLLV